MLPPPPDTELGKQRSALAPADQCVDHAAGVGVSAIWSGATPGTYSVWDGFDFTVTNYDPFSNGIRVSLRATGLDGRTVTNEMAYVVLASNQSATYPVHISDFPVRDAHAPSQVELVAEVTGSDDPQRVGLSFPSESLQYTFAPDYQTATIHESEPHVDYLNALDPPADMQAAIDKIRAAGA